MSLYLGKIERSGRFVEPVRKKNSTRDIKNLDEYIQKRKRIELGEEKEAFESEYEPLILKELSTNPRDGIAAISKRLGLPYQTTLYWIRKLEKKYGIHYTLEPIFLNKFGFFRFFALAKFKDRRPNITELRKLLESKPQVQAAFLTKGSYDLFIFFLAEDPISAEDFIYEIRSDAALADYPAYWHSSYYTQGIGYIPLRDSFFDQLEKRVWRRSKDQPRKQRDQIFLREYATLKELNSNGMIEFSKIDEKYGLKNGSARYTYRRLLDDKLILRITIAMDSPPIKDTAVFVAEQINLGKFNKNKENFLREELADEGKPLNRYIFAGDIGSPYGIILIAPMYDSLDFDIAEQRLWDTVKGARIKASILTTMLVGRLCYRNIYTEKTWLYKSLITGRKPKDLRLDMQDTL
jgi:DNA-binding Lrp family transcriptional regulator